MRRAVLAGGLALGLVPGAAAQTGSSPDLVRAADEVLQKVVEVRQLAPKGPVRKGVKSREEIAHYLDERVRTEYDDAELEREGRLLKRLGLLPEALDYKGFTLKLLSEQIGGYYDPEKKTFFIAGWLPVEQQRPVMAHELTHALQDQYFDLRRFLKRDHKLEDDDQVLAHQAVVEGDGMAVMLDYVLEPQGKSFTELPDLVSMMKAQFSAADGQFEVYNQAPLYLRETLMFPYVYGAAFLQKVKGRGAWAAVDRLYRELPESTEQIMHPEKYLDRRDRPRPVDLPDPAKRLGRGWRATYRNVLGEFSLRVLLETEVPAARAAAAAAGWGGDRVLLAEGEKGAEAVFFESVWDTPGDASEFFATWSAVLRARFPAAAPESPRPDRWVLVSGGQRHTLTLAGSRVRAVIARPADGRADLDAFWP